MYFRSGWKQKRNFSGITFVSVITGTKTIHRWTRLSEPRPAVYGFSRPISLTQKLFPKYCASDSESCSRTQKYSRSFKVFAAVRQSIYCLARDLPLIMIDALYCRSTAVLLAMHVWLYVVAVQLYCTWSQVQVRRMVHPLRVYSCTYRYVLPVQAVDLLVARSSRSS